MSKSSPILLLENNSHIPRQIDEPISVILLLCACVRVMCAHRFVYVWEAGETLHFKYWTFYLKITPAGRTGVNNSVTPKCFIWDVKSHFDYLLFVVCGIFLDLRSATPAWSACLIMTDRLHAVFGGRSDLYLCILTIFSRLTATHCQSHLWMQRNPFGEQCRVGHITFASFGTSTLLDMLY